MYVVTGYPSPSLGVSGNNILDSCQVWAHDVWAVTGLACLIALFLVACGFFAVFEKSMTSRVYLHNFLEFNFSKRTVCTEVNRGFESDPVTVENAPPYVKSLPAQVVGIRQHFAAVSPAWHIWFRASGIKNISERSRKICLWRYGISEFHANVGENFVCGAVLQCSKLYDHLHFLLWVKLADRNLGNLEDSPTISRCECLPRNIRLLLCGCGRFFQFYQLLAHHLPLASRIFDIR